MICKDQSYHSSGIDMLLDRHDFSQPKFIFLKANHFNLGREQ